MTWNCVMCGKFVPDDSSEEHCDRCLEILNGEMAEIATGIGTGSTISGRYGTKEYCRHIVDRVTNGIPTYLNWLVERTK
jgi:hypothetical protein